MVVIKYNDSVQEVSKWLEFFQKVDIADCNRHLQFTEEIQTNEEEHLFVAKQDKVKIHKYDRLLFMDMNIRWSPEGRLEI